MKKEVLNQFQGKENVTHIICDNGAESYMTQRRSFSDEAYAKGACKLNTVDDENKHKHVLFLFNNKDEEVGRYYLGRRLQGKSPSDLVEIKDCLEFFDSWNPESKSWVPCVSLMVKKSKPLIHSNSNSTDNYTSSNNKRKFSYTEEDFRREIANQEEKDLLEYGTTDKKEIELIKKDKRENMKIHIILVIVVFIVPIFLMSMIQKCTGSHYNPLEDNTPWEPRHTQIYKPVYNTKLQDYTVTTESDLDVTQIHFGINIK